MNLHEFPCFGPQSAQRRQLEEAAPSRQLLRSWRSGASEAFSPARFLGEPWENKRYTRNVSILYAQLFLRSFWSRNLLYIPIRTVAKSCTCREVLYPIIHRVSTILSVAQDFFHPQHHSPMDIFMTGWWVFSHPTEKYEFVNWDDDIPNINGKIKFMATKPPTSIVDKKHWLVVQFCCRPAMLQLLTNSLPLKKCTNYCENQPLMGRSSWSSQCRSPAALGHSTTAIKMETDSSSDLPCRNSQSRKNIACAQTVKLFDNFGFKSVLTGWAEAFVS